MSGQLHTFWFSDLMSLPLTGKDNVDKSAELLTFTYTENELGSLNVYTLMLRVELTIKIYNANKHFAFQNGRHSLPNSVYFLLDD